ncbi:MAG: hypothetical protein HY558_02920, partial [Euryarchaeota archaeon]|nr:hypothetical protein [Euryarchaeota archaeon]
PPAPHQVSRGEGGLQELPAFHPWQHEGLLNIPQNWDIHESPPGRAAAIAKMGGLISAKAHIAPEYDGEPTPNGLTEENIQRLLAVLEELEKHDVEYVTLAEAAEMWRSGRWRGPE